MRDKTIQERAAIVTGGARGIGRGIAQRLCAAGAKVLIADIDVECARQTAEEMSGKGREVVPCRLDVSNEDSVLNMVRLAMKEFGDIHILVNNAGIMLRTRFHDLDIEEWETMLKVNLTGPFLCMKAVLPSMMKNPGARIINISSSAGRSVSTLGGAHYTASKSGLLGLTRAVAKEVAPYGITVNAICPGLIDTPMVKDTTKPEELYAFLDSFPIQRLGLPTEIGDLVVFLCSDRASYITGASIDINGGSLMI
jgi:3-oxoacyl-[acyl-carrier protein] reductase